MSSIGLDTVSDVSNIVSTIKSKGYEFVVRYYSKSGNAKRMSTAESEAIFNAGLKRVVVYQNLHNDYSKFGSTIATTDATDAISQAKAHGQPSSTIYFAVDYDASSTEIEGNIKEHFKVLQKNCSLAGYAIGVYGSTLVCKKLKEAGLVSKTWVANASGWGYGTQFSDYKMKQSSQVSFGGITFDKNTANDISYIGAW